MAAAVVGGVAYHVGKKGAQASQQEDEQNQAIADLQAQQAQQQAPPPQEYAPAAPATGGGIADQLTQLKGLLDSGVLSQEEFDAAKAKALAGG
jgi:hypothetical protein